MDYQNCREKITQSVFNEIQNFLNVWSNMTNTNNRGEFEDRILRNIGDGHNGLYWDNIGWLKIVRYGLKFDNNLSLGMFDW